MDDPLALVLPVAPTFPRYLYGTRDNPVGNGSLVFWSRNRMDVTHLAETDQVLRWHLAPKLAAFALSSCERDGSDSAASSLAPRIRGLNTWTPTLHGSS